MMVASEIQNVMTGHIFEIGLFSWLPDDTFLRLYLLFEYFECSFYVFMQHCQFTVSYI